MRSSFGESGMPINRRRLFGFAALAGAAAGAPAASAAGISFGSLGVDATHFGLHPGSPDDQTRILQNAIDSAARVRTPLAIPPGRYRAGSLRLPSGAQLAGVWGATHLILTTGPSLFAATGADHLRL